MQIRHKNCWSISCVNGCLLQINLFVRPEHSPKAVMNRSAGDVNKLIMFYVASKGLTGDCKWKTLESFALITKALALSFSSWESNRSSCFVKFAKQSFNSLSHLTQCSDNPRPRLPSPTLLSIEKKSLQVCRLERRRKLFRSAVSLCRV